MSETTKALIFMLSVIIAPFALYFIFISVKEYLSFKNAIHVHFKKEGNKIKGYKKKDGEWTHDESLKIEDEDIDNNRV